MSKKTDLNAWERFMRNFKLSLVVTAAMAVAVAAVATPSQAVNATWNGTDDGVWATTTNWSTSPVPGTGNTATFDNAGGAVDIINLGGGVTIRTILFDTASAAAYTIGSGGVGVQTLTLDNTGAVTMNATVASNQLINANLVLGTANGNNTFTLTNDSLTNSLAFAGGISSTTTGNKTLTVTGAGATSISGALTNGSGVLLLTKAGSGTQTLTGANTYTGATTVNDGKLLLDMTGSGALAATSPLTLGGGTFEIKGKAAGTTAQTMGILTLAATSGSTIALNPNNGTSTTLTLGNAWSRPTGGSTVLFDYSSASSGDRTVVTAAAVSGSGGAVQGGQMGPALRNGIFGYALVKDAGGIGFATRAAGVDMPITRYDDTAGTTLAIASNDQNVNFTTLNTVYTTGTLDWTNGGALGIRKVNSLTIDTTNSGGIIDMGASTNLLTINSGGILFKGSNDATLTGGTLGGCTNGGWGNSEVIVHQTGTGVLTINSPYGHANFFSSGVPLSYAAPGCFVKNGDGVVVLSGASTYGLYGGYNGPAKTTINGGILRAGVATVPGVSGAFGVGSVVTLADVAGAALDANSFDIAIGGLAGGGALGGNVTLGDAALTTGRNVTTTYTYAGVISSTGSPTTSLIKVGTCPQILTGASTYTGATSVSGGTLTLAGTAGSLASTGAVTVSDGATLTAGDTTVANNNGVNDRINPLAPLTLGGGSGGGTFTLYKPATGDITQSLASLTVAAGASTIQNLGSGGTATLTFTGSGASVYTRSSPGTVNFASAMTSFDEAPSTNVSAGTVGAGGLDTILVGAFLNNADFVKAVAGVVAASDYDAQNDPANWGTAAGHDGNIRGAFNNGTTVAGTVSINSLKSTGPGTINIGTLSTDSLSIKSGMILNPVSNTTPLTINGPGSLTSGNSEGDLVFNAHNPGRNSFITVNAPISISGNLVKTGDWVLSLTSTANSIGGDINIGAAYDQYGYLSGWLDFNPTGTATYANSITGIGAITKSGTGTLNLTGPVTIAKSTSSGADLGGQFTVNADGGTVNLTGTTTIGSTVTVNNGGTLNLTGPASLGGVVNVNAGGTLQWSSAFSAPGTKASTITVGSASTTARAVATISVPAGSTLDTGALYVGKDNTGNGGSPAGHELTINIGSGGTMDLNTGYVWFGGNGASGGGTGTLNINGADDTARVISGYQAHFDPGRGPNSIGYFNLSGGLVQPVYSQWANGGIAIAYQSGGTYKPSAGGTSIGNSGPGTSIYTMTGGTMTMPGGINLQSATMNIIGTAVYSGAGAALGRTEGTGGMTGTLNIAGGGSFTASQAQWIGGGVSLSDKDYAQGVLNLAAGGSLNIAGGISGVSGNNNTDKQGTMNFSGGTIKYDINAASINYSLPYWPYNKNKTWMGEWTHAFVYPGGLTVDTQTYTGGFSQALEAATGSGVTSVTLDAPGAGYTAAPIVSFLNGTLVSGIGTLGVEAEAIATFDRDSGELTGIVIVNPGQYSVLPDTVLLSQPAGDLETWMTPAMVSIGSTASNAGGGLTKLGTGTLTLTGENTYTGDTIVQAGTLSYMNLGDGLDDDSAVSIALDAFLNLNFFGSDTIAELWLDDVEMAPGTYDSSDPTYGSYFTGDGSLLVKVGLPDADGNGVVNAADYIALKRNMGQATGATTAQGDFDADGDVDWHDLQILQDHYGETSAGAAGSTASSPPSGTIPEPGSAILLLLGTAVRLGGLRRRRGIIDRPRG